LRLPLGRLLLEKVFVCPDRVARDSKTARRLCPSVKLGDVHEQQARTVAPDGYGNLAGLACTNEHLATDGATAARECGAEPRPSRRVRWLRIAAYVCVWLHSLEFRGAQSACPAAKFREAANSAHSSCEILKTREGRASSHPRAKTSCQGPPQIRESATNRRTPGKHRFSAEAARRHRRSAHAAVPRS
jgi:hypothetical protein